MHFRNRREAEQYLLPGRRSKVIELVWRPLKFVRQTGDSCEGVRNAQDGDVIIMTVYVRAEYVKSREREGKKERKRDGLLTASFCVASVKE